MHHRGVLGSYPVSVQYLEDQYKGTRPVQGHEYCMRIGDLEFSSGRDLDGYRLFFSKQLKDHQLPKVVRQHDQYLSLEVDEEGFADIDEVARCFKLNNKRAPDFSIKAIIAIASKDNKNRFEFRCQRSQALALAWSHSFGSNAVQEHVYLQLAVAKASLNMCSKHLWQLL